MLHASRTRLVHATGDALKEGVQTLREAVGIASEPPASEVASHDFLWSDLPGMTADEMQRWRQTADEMGILRGETQLRASRARDVEFSFPFSRSAFYANPSMVEGRLTVRNAGEWSAKPASNPRRAAGGDSPFSAGYGPP